MLNSGINKTAGPIVFFGTGPVAAASLKLLANSFAIEAVVTKPRPPHHRGDVPVLEIADDLGIPLITVSHKTELSDKLSGCHFKSNIAVLIDFGIIVKQDVIDYFPLGIVNSHFSLLPEWRGADPITFAILSGQHRTGVSLMLLVEAMDEGPLLAQAPYDIAPDETTPSLTEALIELSYKSLCEVLPLYISGNISPAPQESTTIATNMAATYSRKLTKLDGIIDFTKSATTIEREIRAYVEWPKSHATIAGRDVIITAAKALESVKTEKRTAGTAFIHNKELCVQTGAGIIVVKSLKPAGKPEMSASAFIAGYGHMLR